MVNGGSRKETLAEEYHCFCGVWLGMCLDGRVAGMGKDMARLECDRRGAPLGPPMLITQKSNGEPQAPQFSAFRLSGE